MDYINYIKIPLRCYALNKRTINPQTGIGDVIEIRAFEKGFYTTLPKLTQVQVDVENKIMGISPEVAEAMYVASMFGWDVYKINLDRLENKNEAYSK